MGKLTVEGLILDEVKEVKILLQAIRVDVVTASKRADDAHARIDKYENRFWGWVFGVGGLGAAGGMTFSEGVRSLFKSLSG